MILSLDDKILVLIFVYEILLALIVLEGIANPKDL